MLRNAADRGRGDMYLSCLPHWLFYHPTNNDVSLTNSFDVFQVVRAFMLVVAVLITAITARPDSAGIVERVNGLAYGNIYIFF
jgi:hypothetical protein